jgi:hypothetical protein
MISITIRKKPAVALRPATILLSQATTESTSLYMSFLNPS